MFISSRCESVFLSLSTDGFWRNYNNYVDKGISFIREPVVFKDGTNCCIRRSLRKYVGFN